MVSASQTSDTCWCPTHISLAFMISEYEIQTPTVTSLPQSPLWVHIHQPEGATGILHPPKLKAALNQ